MTRVLNSFKVRSGSKVLDYRLGGNLDLREIENFFQEKGYEVRKIWNGSRHVLGLLEKGKTFFLKLSSSEGISIVTKNEYKWNNYFNQHLSIDFYRVPENYDSGFYQKKYYYLITDYFDGKLLCETRESYESVKTLNAYIPRLIELSELIQKLPGKEEGYQKRFMKHVKNWFSDIPVDVRKKYDVGILLKIIETGVTKLSSKVRHGDFAPWHIIKLPKGRLGLIDGEHFLVNGVENYDVCYFIQRVFAVLKNPDIAIDIYSRLIQKGYKKDKLKVILAARAVGGFLDESLIEDPDYLFANDFKNWLVGV